MTTKKLTDCPSNMTEAVYWILRVTGKDGQVGGSGNETKLAKAIVDLEGFKDAIEAAEAKLNESGNGATQALENLKSEKTLGHIIMQLADGLGTFIGYQGGTIKHDSTGIGLPNDPRERLGDAVLGFIAEYLRTLDTAKTLGKVAEVEVTGVSFESLKNSLGKGADAVDGAIKGMTKLQHTNNKINGVVTELKSVEQLENKSDLSSFVPKVKEYLEGVLEEVATHVANENDAKTQVNNLKSKLDDLLDKITNACDGKSPFKFGATGLKTYIDNVEHGETGALKQLHKVLPNHSTGHIRAVVSAAYNGVVHFKGADLKNFMDLMAFSAHWLNGGKNGDNVRNVMNTSFKDLAAATASTYAAFLKNLKDKAGEYVKNPTNNPLSALFYCSKAYFQGCQAKVTQTRPPSSIREMLYWLSGLQFAPGYRDLENQIDSIIKTDFKVAISGSPKSNEQLTSDQVTEYLVTTCLHAQTVFSTIQAPGISNNADEPWLHSLYSNAEFKFTYPSSGTALLYTISNYVYALQFQFQFLYKQCEFDYENGCGWFYCKFGRVFCLRITLLYRPAFVGVLRFPMAHTMVISAVFRPNLLPHSKRFSPTT
ncbi:variant erythrocyte surface antigen-1 family protein [Babesia caballi]|uniref:Variant erythrocyte surface antigen-1 family protein n=1 Tax=Babesia caballi TaxID=5871 RepID=A0AAV4M2D7_BABCB|nr:variant erythrocyte surface antigen-1 family protein [Babesia caballi]